MTIFEKVLERMGKRQDSSVLFVKELHKFFEGLDLDLFEKDDEKNMYSVNVIINQYLDIFQGVKTKDDLQKMFYQKEEIHKMLSREEEIQTFVARELITF